MTTTETQEKLKRQRSPSPAPQDENTAGEGAELGRVNDERERREAKKPRIGEHVTTAVAHDSTNTVGVDEVEDKKRKRAVDEESPPAGSHLPSATSLVPSGKKRKGLPPNAATTPTLTSHNSQSSFAGTHLGSAPLQQGAGSPTLPLAHMANAGHPGLWKTLAASNKEHPMQRSSNLPPGFDELPEHERTAQQSAEDHNPEPDLYGSPVCLPLAHRGFCTFSHDSHFSKDTKQILSDATSYYPQRQLPFQIPTGKLSDTARAECYKGAVSEILWFFSRNLQNSQKYVGLSETQIKERELEYQKRSEDCPLIFQEAFKHTARGRLDKTAHLWLIPRIHNYYNTDQDGRSNLLDRIVRDLVHEFPDLHPNFLKLRNSAMEKEYLSSLRNLVSVAASGIKSTLGNPSKVEAINKDVVKQLTGPKTASRPHDLWMKSVLDRLKDEEPEMDSDDSEAAQLRRRQLAEARDIQAAWDTVYDDTKEKHGAKYAKKHRLRIEQEFRQAKFSQLGEEVQAIWEGLAVEADKAIDPTTALIGGMPFVNLVTKRFGEIAKVPLVIMIGAPDLQNPGQYLVYQ